MSTLDPQPEHVEVAAAASPSTARQAAMLASAIVVLALVALVTAYAWRRSIFAAHSAEAKSAVAAIARGTAAFYERETVTGGCMIPEGSHGEEYCGNWHRLCTAASAVPGDFAKVAGAIYTPDPTPGRDFETGDWKNAWRCLKFAPTGPIRYQYHYHALHDLMLPPAGSPDESFEAVAIGDLDGDGERSVIGCVGNVDVRAGVTHSRPLLYLENELE